MVRAAAACCDDFGGAEIEFFFKQFEHLPPCAGHAFENGAGSFRTACRERQAEKDASCIGVPYGRPFAEQIWEPLAGGLQFSLWWIVGGAVVLIAGGIWAIFHWSGSNRFCGKVAGWIRGLGAGFASIGKMKHKWLFALYTVAIWASYVAMSWSGLKAVPMLSELTFSDAIFISAVGNIASVIPVPGGIGAYHYLVALTLQSIYGIVWETGILYATLCHEAHAILIILLGVISYVAITLRRRKQ